MLKRPIGANEQLAARQVVGGTAAAAVLSPSADPLPEALDISVPTPHACMTGLWVHGVTDGAEVEIETRAGDPSSLVRFSVPVSDMFLPLPALVEDQKLTVREVMQRCQQASPLHHLQVEAMSFPAAPVVESTLCTGSASIAVSGLVSGAEVVVTQGDTVIGSLVAYDAAMALDVAPLVAGTAVTVTETLCGVSTATTTPPVDAAPAEPQACHVVTPLIECDMTIWVENGRPGALVTVISDKKGAISHVPMHLAKDGRIALSSPLQKEHRITVTQAACGGAPIESDNHPDVKELKALPAPKIVTPLFADPPQIAITGCTPGATVQVYAREAGFLTEGIADHKGNALVPRKVLIPGWHVWARQILCAQISDGSQVVPVVDRTPLQPIIVSPAVGATGTELRPHLSWTDPGKGTVRQAANFLVQVTTPTHPAYDATAFKTYGNFTAVDLDHDLVYSTAYIWQVIPAVGDPGWEVLGPTANGSFTTKAAPPPPPPPPTLTSLKHGTTARHYLLKGINFLPSHAVHVRIAVLDMRDEYVNAQADGSQIRSDATGSIDVEIALPNLDPTIQLLYFSANDERPDSSDLTGTLWSNTLDINP
jgi:hypothetical protein